MKYELKHQAIRLRKQGYMFSEISKELNISRSTARTWTFDIALTKTQAKRVKQRKLEHQRIKMQQLTLARDRALRDRELKLIDEAKAITNNLIWSLNQKRILCSLLYWCEGTKDVSSGIKFTNSDPILVKKFIGLLRESFIIQETKFRALLHLHEYHDPVKQLKFWSQVTRIPQEQFHKIYMKPHTAINKQANYPGCISLRYLDASLGKTLKMIYSEYGRKS